MPIFNAVKTLSMTTDFAIDFLGHPFKVESRSVLFVHYRVMVGWGRIDGTLKECRCLP